MDSMERILGMLVEFKDTSMKRMDQQDIDLQSILEQTTKTNGRVTQLEKERDQEKQKKDKRMGTRDRLIWAFAGGAGSLALTSLGWLVVKFLNKHF